MKPWWQRKTVTVNDVLLLAFVLVAVSVLVLWATAGRAEESCGGITTAQGRPAVESAKIYREQHECLMRLADQSSVDTLKDPAWYQEFRRLTDDSLTCLQRMEAAMRAMDEFITPQPRSDLYESYDGCNYCGAMGCTLMACPNGGDPVAKAEWDLKQAKKQAEAARLRSIASQQWESVKKECWRDK